MAWNMKHLMHTLHQWLRSSALKIGRLEVKGSIPGRACRPRLSEFSVVFSESCINTIEDSLERPPRNAFYP